MLMACINYSWCGAGINQRRSCDNGGRRHDHQHHLLRLAQQTARPRHVVHLTPERGSGDRERGRRVDVPHRAG